MAEPLPKWALDKAHQLMRSICQSPTVQRGETALALALVATRHKSLPKWALDKAQKTLGFTTEEAEELGPEVAAEFQQMICDVALALVATRRKALEEAAQIPTDKFTRDCIRALTNGHKQ